MMLRARLFAFAVLAAAPLSTGCAGIAGDQTVPVNFDVKAHPDGTFFYWNEIYFDTGGVSVDSALLTSVTLQTSAPEGTPDLTFMSNLVGQGVGPTQTATFCIGSNFPRGEAETPAQVVYHDNIAPFVQDNSFRVQWSGNINPAVAFPPDGFTVTATLVISPQ